jgi:hypothetical protein
MWSVRIPRGRPRPAATRMAERFGLDQIRRLSMEQALRHRGPPSIFAIVDRGRLPRVH